MFILNFHVRSWKYTYKPFDLQRIERYLGFYIYNKINAVLKKNSLFLQNMTAEERTLGELTQQVAQAHQSLHGVRPDIAELQYLIEAQQLDNYGLEYYPAKVRILWYSSTKSKDKRKVEVS